MSDHAVEALGMPADSPETAFRPYSWIGLALGVIALVALIIVIFLALVLVAFIVEIPIEGWHEMSRRAAWVTQIVRNGQADGLIPQRLLMGALRPVTPRVIKGYLLVSMLPELSGILAVFALARFRAGTRWRDVSAWHPWSFRKNAFAFVILLVVALACNLGAGLIEAHFAPGERQTLASFDLTYVLLFAFEGIVLAACMEELVMRGWFYTALRTKLAAWPTIIIAAVIFAGAHLGVSVGAVLATLPLGLAAGYLRERTGSVRATITFHMLHNIAAMAALLLH